MFRIEFVRCRGNTCTMCEFHDSNSNGLGDMWWTDNCIYFSSIDIINCIFFIATTHDRAGTLYKFT